MSNSSRLLPYILSGDLTFDEKASLWIEISPYQLAMPHQDAVRLAEQTKYGEVGGWRLPTKGEAEHLLRRYKWFRGYWTSTEHTTYSDYAWNVHFCESYTKYCAKNNRYNVCCVHDE